MLQQYKHSRFEVGLRTLLLRARNLTPDNVLPHIILLVQVEEFANLGRTLRPETLGEDVVGEPRDLVIALLDDNEGEDGDIGADDAATNRLAAALTGATGAVARVAVGKEEADTVGDKDTLLHRETLFVVAAGDTEDVASPLIANRVGRNFLRDFLVEEDTAV